MGGIEGAGETDFLDRDSRESGAEGPLESDLSEPPREPSVEDDDEDDDDEDDEGDEGDVDAEGDIAAADMDPFTGPLPAPGAPDNRDDDEEEAP